MIMLDLKKDTGMILDLTKAAPNLKNLRALLNWGMHPVHGASLTNGFDLDIFCFALNSNGKVTAGTDVVFFNNKTLAGGGVVLPRDNQTGEGDDDEEMNFNLDKIPADKTSIAVYVFIHDAVSRGQHFGMVVDAKIVMSNMDTNENIAQYNLTQNYSGSTAIHVGNLVRNATGWQFEPVGEAGTADPNTILGYYA